MIEGPRKDPSSPDGADVDPTRAGALGKEGVGSSEQGRDANPSPPPGSAAPQDDTNASEAFPPSHESDPQEFEKTRPRQTPAEPGHPPAAAPPDESLASAPTILGAQAGRILGDFRIIREIGRGGMGAVYEAEQISLRRKVALKVLAPHLSLSNDLVLKFRREAEAGSRQAHSGIVSVYSVGEHEGIHFIVYELIEGGVSLSDRLQQHDRVEELPHNYFEQTAELFALVADALGHAHGNGVTHRDVKPSNILIAPDGSPKVTDFGLAKIEDTFALTRTGELAGTPFYMSPEQVSGQRDGLDHRTDVYSLGVSLYEALTLERPFPGDSAPEIMKRILYTEPRSPRKRNPHIPRDLEVICMKAMEKEPSARYATMGDMAAELRRWLAGEPIRSRPTSPVARTVKWAKRNRTISLAVLAVLSIFLALGAITLIRNWQTTRGFNRLIAQAESSAVAGQWDEAVDLLVEALAMKPNDPLARERHRSYVQQKELAAVTVERDEKEKALLRSEALRLAAESKNQIEENPTLALLLALESAKRLPGLVTNNAVAEAFAASYELVSVYYRRFPYFPEAQKHERDILRCADFTVDGSAFFTFTVDNRPALWDARTGEKLWRLEQEALPGEATLGSQIGGIKAWRNAVSLDGRNVGFISNQDTAWILDIQSRQRTTTLRTSSRRGFGPNCLAFHPDGRMIVTTSADSTVSLWNAETGEPLEVLAKLPDAGLDPRFSRDGRYFACTDGRTAWLWGTSTWDKPRVLEVPGRKIRALDFSPDGNTLATATGDMDLRLWDCATGKVSLECKGQGNPLITVNEIAFSPDGSLFSATWGDQTVQIWDSSSGREVTRLVGHTGIVRSVEFSPDGSRIVTSSFDETARIWDTATGRQLRVLRGHEDFLHWAHFSPDGRTVLTISEDATAKIWNAEIDVREEPISGGTVDRLRFDEREVYSPDGRVLEINGPEQGVVTLRDPRSGKPALQLKRKWDYTTGGRFSPDGRLVVTGSRRRGLPKPIGVADIWDAETGAYLDSIFVGVGSVVGGVFSQDCSRLTTAMSSGEVHVWDLATGEALRTYRGHDRWVTTFGSSEDGRLIVTASLDETARIWDPETGETLQVLEGHGGELLWAAFSADASHVVTKAGDGTARLWSTETGEELLTIQGVNADDDVGFSPNGQSVVILPEDGPARRYPIDVVEVAERSKPRELTPMEKRSFGAWDPGEEQALTIVEELFDELSFTSNVVEHLKEDEELREQVRSAAIEFALLQEENPYLLYEASVQHLQNALNTSDFRNAARYARILARIVSDDSSYLPTLVGSALYRCGEYEEAITQIRRYHLGHSGEPTRSDVLGWGYLAMACKRLGRHEESRAALKRFRELRGKVDLPDEFSSFVDEVEATVSSGPSM